MRSEHSGENRFRFRMASSPLNVLILPWFFTFRGVNVAQILMRSQIIERFRQIQVSEIGVSSITLRELE